MISRRRIAVLGLVACVGFWSASVSADEQQKRQCISGYENGQRLQLASDLEQAASKFEACSTGECPPIVRRECARLLSAARAATPAIEFAVKLGSGLSGPVRVSVDGREAEAYEGGILHVNPGKHRFVFECAGCETVSRRISFSDAELKHKEIHLNSACAGPEQDSDAEQGGSSANGGLTQPVDRASPIPLRPARQRALGMPCIVYRPLVNPEPAFATTSRRQLALAGTGSLAALGGIAFIGFGLHARSSERSLLDCAPFCSEGRIASVKRDYLWANVALGASLLSLTSAGVIWMSGWGSASSQASASRRWLPHIGRRWGLDVGPISTFSASF